MNLSSQQKSIFNEFNSTRNNIFIQATAGSGKTTTLVELSKQIPQFKKVLFVAFNKSIVNELKTKLPDFVDVYTVHSIAYRTLLRNVKLNVKLTEIKNWIYAEKFIKKKFENDKQRSLYFFTLSQIINLMKLNLIKPYDVEEIRKICNEYNITILNGEVEDSILLYNEIENINYNSKHKENIDFTDMLYLTHKLIKDEDYNKYDVVMVDEVQDINPLQREIILKLKKKNGRLISVGDDKQTIYSFMGSNFNSFNYLKNLPNTTVLPLSVTYRCGKNIVKEANKYFKDILPFDKNVDGVVRNGSFKEAKAGDYIICRNNLPLFKVFIYFLKQSVKSSIKEKDFLKNLLNLIFKIDEIDDLSLILKNKKEDLKNQDVKNINNHPTIVSLTEKIEIINILYKEFNDLTKVKGIIENLVKDKTEGVILSTIHKSKGLEADRVFILNKELIPSKYAQTEQDFYAEKCLMFVAITRAKKELIYCNIKMKK